MVSASIIPPYATKFLALHYFLKNYVTFVGCMLVPMGRPHKKQNTLMKNLKLLIIALGALVAMTACSKSPATPDVSFAYSTYSYSEGYDGCYVAVYQMESPYEFPVEVNLHGKVIAGKDHLGNKLKWTDIIEFEIDADEPEFTVTNIDDKNFEISGVQVTYTEYNKKVFFKSKANDYLQNETIKIEFTITDVKGSTIGSSKTTIVTIVDDEKAPLIKTGFYKTDYTPLADAHKTTSGSFYLRLYKTDKYEYVATGWFGLSRPRLVGQFDPEAQTLTFDGTDYDHTQWFDKEDEIANRVNAFENDTLWGYSVEEDIVKQVLKFYGSGARGKEPIVIKTDKIEENASGFLVEIEGSCGFDIWNYDAESHKATSFVGTWDGMEKSTKMTHSSTDYEVEGASRGALGTYPTPFSQWELRPIND